MGGDADEDWRHDGFTPVGIIRVTPSALELARALGEAGRREAPGKDWVVTFGWHLSQRVWEPGSKQWVEEGPGLGAGGYERRRIPEDRIEVVDGVEFAIAIPQHIWEAAAERLIDVAAEGSVALALR